MLAFGRVLSCGRRLGPFLLGCLALQIFSDEEGQKIKSSVHEGVTMGATGECPQSFCSKFFEIYKWESFGGIYMLELRDFQHLRYKVDVILLCYLIFLNS